jgi:hypothetical protein
LLPIDIAIFYVLARVPRPLVAACMYVVFVNVYLFQYITLPLSIACCISFGSSMGSSVEEQCKCFEFLVGVLKRVKL